MTDRSRLFTSFLRGIGFVDDENMEAIWWFLLYAGQANGSHRFEI
jgi:hypothetical protein